MKAVKIENIREFLTEGTKCLAPLEGSEKAEGVECLLPMEGGGLDVTPLVKGSQRYLSFYLENLEEHSLSMNLLVYREEDSGDGKEDA